MGLKLHWLTEMYVSAAQGINQPFTFRGVHIVKTLLVLTPVLLNALFPTGRRGTNRLPPSIILGWAARSDAASRASAKAIPKSP